MLLTIAIPAHNKASYLQKAIKSIIKDDEFGKNVNIVISDNSYNPEIKNLYERYYINNKRISYFSSKKYDCLDSNVNRSIQLANGKYVWVFGTYLCKIFFNMFFPLFDETLGLIFKSILILHAVDITLWSKKGALVSKLEAIAALSTFVNISFGK